MTGEGWPQLVSSRLRLLYVMSRMRRQPGSVRSLKRAQRSESDQAVRVEALGRLRFNLGARVSGGLGGLEGEGEDGQRHRKDQGQPYLRRSAEGT